MVERARRCVRTAQPRYHKVLYCVRGSIVFRMTATGEEIALAPGDRLDIEPGTEHAAVVGAGGVECIEAARQ
jgi:quercetin dioxygenase-like cupin family protein